MTSDEQLKKWVAGESVHNGPHGEGECCPDFSCCKPNLQAAPEIRQAFAASDSKQRYKFLGGFLAAAISAMGGKDIYVAGGDPENKS